MFAKLHFTPPTCDVSNWGQVGAWSTGLANSRYSGESYLIQGSAAQMFQKSCATCCVAAGGCITQEFPAVMFIPQYRVSRNIKERKVSLKLKLKIEIKPSLLMTLVVLPLERLRLSFQLPKLCD